MKVSSTELPPRQVTLDIEVEQERVDREMDQAFRRVAGNVNVPGFRKGKAPRALVERMVGRQTIVEDAIEHLVPIVVSEAIDQEKVEPFGRPQIDSIEMDPLRVKAIVPLAPKVELGEYREQLRIERQEPEVGDSQVDEVIERLRGSYAQWAPVERPVQLADRVSMDVKGEALNPSHPYVDSKDAEYVVDPAGPEPAPGFAEQLLGLKPAEEKSFNLTLAADEPDSTLQNREIAFTVKVNWIKEKQLPEIDDAFAQQTGDHPDLATLRASVENQLRERETQRIGEERQNAALDKLVELSTVEVAPQIVERQTQYMLDSFAQNVERQGLKLEQYLQYTNRTEEQLRDDMRGRAEQQVLRSLALEKFAEAEAIAVERTEIETEIREAASRMPNPAETEKAALEDTATLERMESALRERKAMAHLIALALGESTNGTSAISEIPTSTSTDVDTDPSSGAEKVPSAVAETQEKV